MIAARASPPEFRPILLSAPLVAAAHLALLWAALHWTPPFPAPVAAPSFAIDLEAMPTSAATPSPPAPEPQVQPQVQPQPQPQARVEPAPPAPRPVRKPAPKPVVAAPAAPVAELAEAVPSPPSEEAPAAAAPSGPSRPGPAAVPPLPRAEMSRWQGALLAHLERHKRYPRDAQMRRQEGAATIRFVMDSSGRVLSATLERGSGVESLDRESLALIERAQPLPLPPGGGAERIDLAVPIRFQLR